MPEELNIEQPEVAQEQFQQEPPDKTRALYDGLYKTQLYTKSYDEFKKQYNNPEAIGQLYKGLNDNQLYLKSKDDFYAQYFGSNTGSGLAQATGSKIKVDEKPLETFFGKPAVDISGKIAEDRMGLSQLEKNAKKSQDNIFTNLHTNDTNYEKLIREDRANSYTMEQMKKDYKNQGQIIPIGKEEQWLQREKKRMYDLPVSPEDISDAKSGVILNEQGTRSFINRIGDKKLQSDIYMVDAHASASNDPNGDARAPIIAKNKKKIEKGELKYDPESGALTKPETFYNSLVTAWHQKNKLFENYDYYTDNDKKTVIQKLENDIKNQDPDKPIPVPEGFGGHAGALLGGNPVSVLLAGGIAGAGVTALGNPEAAPAAAKVASTVVGGREFYKMGYAAALEQGYTHFRQQGFSEEEAYDKANQLAHSQGATDAIMGAAMSGISFGRAFAPSASVTQAFKQSIFKGLTQLGENATKKALEGLGVGAVGATGQILKNIQAQQAGINVEDFEGVKEQLGAGLWMTIGAAMLAKGSKALTGKTKTEIVQGLSKLPEEQLAGEMNNLVETGQITEQQAKLTIETVQEHKAIDQMIPEDVPEVNRLKIGAKIKERNILEEKIENTDKAFHEDLKERVKKLNEDILTLASEKEEKSDNAKLVEKNLDKIPAVYHDIAKSDPDGFLQFIADQSFGRNEEGVVIENAAAEKEMRNIYGDKLVDKAKELYPLTQNIEQNASNVRENQGELPSRGEILENSQEIRGNDIQQVQEQPSVSPGATEQARGGEQKGNVEGQKEIAYDDFKNHAIEMVSTVKAGDRGTNWIIDLPGMTQADREGAIADIQAGKKTKRAERFEQAVQDMYNKGVVSVARGFGNHAESVDIPIKDWFSLDSNERNAAAEMDDFTVSIINDNDISLENIDQLKHLFNGFPYSQEDFSAVKAHLEREGAGHEQAQKAGSGIPPISEEKIGEPPPPETSKATTYIERPATELSHRGLQDVANEFSLEDVNTRDRKSDLQLRKDAENTVSDWREKGTYPQKVEELIQDAENGKILTDEQRVILEQHLANVSDSLRSMDKNSPEFDTQLKYIKRLKEAGEKTRSEAGAALRIPGGGSRPESNLADYMVREMEASGVSELTEQQKAQASKEFEEITKAKDELEAKLKIAEDENAKLRAEAEIRKAKGAKKTGEKRDYKTERKDILEHMREQLKKSRGEASVAFVPYAKELIAIAPDVAKLVKSLVEEGIEKLPEIVKVVHDNLKDLIPQITEKDVHNIIAGEYNEKKASRSETLAKLNDLRTQAKLINRLEELENGIEPKDEKKKIRRNREIEELRKKIKENDLTKLSDFKKRTEKQISDLEEKLKKGDFEPEEKKPQVKLDDEALKLKNKLIELKQEREKRLAKLEYEKKNKLEKAWDATVNVLGVPRTVMASFDASAPLRQGFVATVAHPSKAIPAFAEMFKQMFSQKRFDRWLHDLKESPEYQVMEKSGLYVADPNTLHLSQKEEAFMTNLAERIPIVGRAIKGSERAYVSYLNKMRVDIFKQGVERLIADGKTPENSPEIYKALASFINNSTGRGELGKLEPAATVLNSVFFSPRLIASRLNLLNPLYYTKMPKEVRIMALKDMAKTIGFGVTVATLSSLAGASVELDPRSPDFGKVKIGNTRYDIWGGFQQYVRVIAQLISGSTKSSTTSKVTDLTKDDAKKTRADVVGAFFRGKLAPVPGTIWDFAANKTVTGEKPIENKAMDLFIPMIANDISDAWKDQGFKSIFTVGLPSSLGVGVSTYSNKKKK